MSTREPVSHQHAEEMLDRLAAVMKIRDTDRMEVTGDLLPNLYRYIHEQQEKENKSNPN